MRDVYTKIFLMCFLFVPICISAPHACAKDIPVISLPGTARIDNKTILLGEIARITAPDFETAAGLGRIVIGAAPLPGKFRHVNADYIALRLKQEGCDLFRIRPAESGSIRILREAAEVTRDEIKTCVRNFILENMPWDREAVRIGHIRAPEKATLPAGNVAYRAELPKNTEMKGRFPVSVSLFSDGAFQKKVWTSVRMEIFSDVAVTVKPIARYQPITGDDVRLQKMDISSLSNAVTDLRTLVGKRMKRKIDTNTVVRKDWIEVPPLVKRGDVVVIVAKSASIKITTLGKAREKGGKGDRIKVVNLDSDKDVFARVVDAKTVEVTF